jgi:hypothetical protein
MNRSLIVRAVLGLVAAITIIVGVTLKSSIQNIGSDVTVGQSNVSLGKSEALPASFNSRFYYVIPTTE